jgi:hypothetical protein
MNGKTRGNQGRRTGALAAAAAVAALATACGGSGPSPSIAASAGPEAYAHLVALARCMRAHGVPGFPDPSASGTFSDVNGSLDLGSSQVQRAYGACRHLLPGGGPNLAELQQKIQQKREQALPQLLRLARCMRSHGVPNFPDPTPTGLNLKNAGLDPAAAQFQRSLRACQQGLPAGMHVTLRTHASAGTQA